jgi:ferredoxin
MTISITVHENSCRGCALCADICPTLVLSLDTKSNVIRVDAAQDCIGCLSCTYVCPSSALRHEGVSLVKNFSRDLKLTRNLTRYL